MTKLTYKEAGVDKKAGYQEVQLIKESVKKTFNENVLTDLGGFGGLYQLNQNYKQPILVSGTDGVGTKLDLAFKSDMHHTVGIDCVAMCVNDILCQGAKPLFFLDYIATGKLIPEKMAKIVEGVVEGCLLSGAALIGGETAEMPGIYQQNHYDLAGFAVGVVDKEKMIVPKLTKVGDRLIGLKSSGVHSNGFSLVRKIIFEIMKFNLDDYIDELNKTLKEELLTPTKIYVKDVLPLIEKYHLHGIAHITGGGLYENLPRILNKDQGICFDISNYEIPTIFKLLQTWGDIELKEMFETFNMGIGMVLAVDEKEYDAIAQDLLKNNVEYIDMGKIIEGYGEFELCGF